ncbi:MAG: GHMP kinase [Methylococcaceae bacterium]|nr:MAG: GHMP kinase [Methylococcaceae bacterium]
MNVQHSTISILAPARLHMGFFDLSGSLGRHFGSIGIALNEISTQILVTPAMACTIRGPSAERARQCLQQLCTALKVSDKLDITIEQAIPEHVGLGSGTQMSLAIGSALNAIYELGLTVRDIAAITERGLRSGIGIGIFEQGGLVVDGGRGEKTITPPLLVHMPIPAAWYFILVFDQRGQGLHGLQEIEAFQQLPAFPQQEAARLCYLLLMQGLPALAEQNLADFGDVITQLQNSVGGHFAAAQGGVFTSKEVALAMHWLSTQGAVAIGQTSWGPTGFCLVQGQQRAEDLVTELPKYLATQSLVDGTQLRYLVATARNSGGSISFR